MQNYGIQYSLVTWTPSINSCQDWRVLFLAPPLSYLVCCWQLAGRLVHSIALKQIGLACRAPPTYIYVRVLLTTVTKRIYINK